MSVGLNVEPLTDGEVVEVVLAVINDSKEELEYVGFNSVREVEGELGSGSNDRRVFEDGTEMSWFSFEEILVDSETDILDYDVEVSAGEVELIVVMNEMEMGVVAELSRDGKGSHG